MGSYRIHVGDDRVRPVVGAVLVLDTGHSVVVPTNRDDPRAGDELHAHSFGKLAQLDRNGPSPTHRIPHALLGLHVGDSTEYRRTLLR